MLVIRNLFRLLRACFGLLILAVGAAVRINSQPSQPRMNRKDRLYSFTALSIDEETNEHQSVARMYRRDSCKETRIAIEAMQLSKIDQPPKDISESTSLDSAYSIVLERNDLLLLVNEYKVASCDDNLATGYDFEPEIQFLRAAWMNSAGNDKILIILICYDDGEKLDDLGSEDNYHEE